MCLGILASHRRAGVLTIANLWVAVLLPFHAARAGTIQAMTVTDGGQKDSGTITATATNRAEEQDSYTRSDVFGNVSSEVSASASAADARLFGHVTAACPVGEETDTSVVAAVNSTDYLSVGGAAGNVEIAPAVSGSATGSMGQAVNSTGYNVGYRLNMTVATTLGQFGSIQVEQVTSSVGNRNTNTGPMVVAVQPGTQIFLMASQQLAVAATVAAYSGSNTSEATGDYSHTVRFFAIPLTPGMTIGSESGHDYTPLTGDADLSGTVGFSDLLALAQHYGRTSASWSDGDFNHDGAVNFNDLLLLAQQYGQTLPSEGTTAAAAPVPEPSGATILGLVVVTVSVCQTGERRRGSRV